MMGSSLTYVPCRCPVEGLCDVVKTFAMTTHVEQLVFNIHARFPIETIDFVFETLPLGQTLVGIVTCRRVGSIDETEVDSGLKLD